MKTLRLLFLSVVLCLFFNTSRAQYVTIPDTIFVNVLSSRFPGCFTGNQMDTTCTAITTARYLQVSMLPIKDLTGIQYFDSLDSLGCHGLARNAIVPALPQSLTKLTFKDCARVNLPAALPPNLTYLNLIQDSLTNLPALPPTLVYLNCFWSMLTALPALPATLVELNCASNDISALPALPGLLQKLNCSSNRLSTLPALPPGLRELSCGADSLTMLPALPASLDWLDCDNCSKLTALPALPARLQYLFCQNSAIINLPALSPSLKVLYCGSPQLTALPTLPDSLRTFKCFGGTFTSLPTLPLLLKELYIAKVPVTVLPALPSGLTDLTINFTPMSALPPMLPLHLNNLVCSYNQLTALPEMPDTLRSLDCSHNPNLTCLPRLKTIQTLTFNNTSITCIPNAGNVRYSTPMLNWLPLCDPYNGTACRAYWNISGNVYNDINGNCVQSANETAIPLLKVKLLQNQTVVQQVFTSMLGTYAFDADTGDYAVTIDTANIPFDIVCPVSRFDSASITPTDSMDYPLNFGMQCKPGFDVGIHSISISPRPRPGAINSVIVHAKDMAAVWKQICNTGSVSGQLVVSFNGPAAFVSPAPNALVPVVSGNTLTYTVSDWSTVNSSSFAFILRIDTTAQAGLQLCIDATVTPVVGDNNNRNNRVLYCRQLVNSYDPNIKEVSPVGNLDINGDGWLTYTVQFQNTGNAPAENIYITDTIDTDIDIETFQLLDYSFQPTVFIKGNAVRFNFANINLPDSVNDEPNSHGYVQYKVKVKDNAGLGTVINNTAHIYFDFNPPVVTNTTTNTLAEPTGIAAITSSIATMQLYPNPASNQVFISLSNNLTGARIILSDIEGRNLISLSATATSIQLNTSVLSGGVYFITAIKGEQKIMQRLVVGR